MISPLVAWNAEKERNIDFNDPLLESILEKWSENKDKDIQILVAPLFLSPGRHAGEDKEIWQKFALVFIVPKRIF